MSLKSFRIHLFFKVLYVGMSLSARLKFGICDIYFTQNLSMMLCKFYLVRSFDCNWNNNLIMLLRKRNIRFYALKLCFVIEPLSSDQYSKYWQSCFNAVFSTLKQRRWKRWLNFHFQPNTKVEITLIYWRWINVIVSTLLYQSWNNVDKHMSAQLSFSTKS